MNLLIYCDRYPSNLLSVLPEIWEKLISISIAIKHMI